MPRISRSLEPQQLLEVAHLLTNHVSDANLKLDALKSLLSSCLSSSKPDLVLAIKGIKGVFESVLQRYAPLAQLHSALGALAHPCTYCAVLHHAEMLDPVSWKKLLQGEEVRTRLWNAVATAIQVCASERVSE